MPSLKIAIHRNLLNRREINLQRDLDEGEELRVVNHAVFVEVDLLRVLMVVTLISVFYCDRSRL